MDKLETIINYIHETGKCHHLSYIDLACSYFGPYHSSYISLTRGRVYLFVKNENLNSNEKGEKI